MRMRGCTPLVICSDGNYFATTPSRSFSIHVVDLHSGDIRAKLKGHGAQVTAISWSKNGHTVCSTSRDGCVIFWDVASKQRLQQMEYANKIHVYCWACCMGQPGQATICSTSGIVQMLSDGTVKHEAATTEGKMIGICLIASGKVLVVGDANGALLCYPWLCDEFDGPRAPTKVPAHSAPVQHICTAANETLLISAASDSTLIIWDMQVIVNGLEVIPLWNYSVDPVCTVSCGHLEELLHKVNYLGRQVLGADTAARAKAAIKHKELSDAVAEHEKTICSLQGRLKKEGKAHETELEHFEIKAHEKLQCLEKEHQRAVEVLEATFERKLMLISSQAQVQTMALDDKKFAVEENMQRLERDCADRIAQMQQQMERTVAESNQMCDQLRKEGDAMQAEFAQVLEEAETEFDGNSIRMKQEMLALQRSGKEKEEDLNAQIHAYTRDNLRLKGQKLEDTRTMTKMHKQVKELETKLAQQVRKSEDLSLQLQEQRDQACGSQKTIEELQRKITHLEMMAFVMSDRAARFESEVEPRRAEVAMLAEQRLHQDRELTRTMRMIDSFKHCVSNKNEQIRNLKSMSVEERKRSTVCLRSMEHLKGELWRAARASDVPRTNGKPSARSVGLQELTKQWELATDLNDGAEASGVESTAMMEKLVMAVELKAGLCDLRAHRMQRASDCAVSRLQEQATQLLRDNNSLKKENKRLRDQLRARAPQERPLVSASRVEQAVDAECKTLSCSQVPEISEGFHSLGSRASPSRPSSANSLRQLLAHDLSTKEKCAQHSRVNVRPVSANARLCHATDSHRDSKMPSPSTLLQKSRRPHSAQIHHRSRGVSAQKSSKLVTGRALVAANMKMPDQSQPAHALTAKSLGASLTAV